MSNTRLYGILKSQPVHPDGTIHISPKFRDRLLALICGPVKTEKGLGRWLIRRLLGI